MCVCIDDMRRSAGRGDVRDGAAYYEQFDHICLESDVALCDVHPKRPFS